MSLEWTPELSVGVAMLDEQHRSIFSQIRVLREKMRAGRGSEEVGRSLRFLGDYLLTHFACEERLMLQFAYPEFWTHRTEHIEFSNRFVRMRQRLLSAPAFMPSLLVQVEGEIDGWMNDHVSGMDRPLGEFLKKQSQALVSPPAPAPRAELRA